MKGICDVCGQLKTVHKDKQSDKTVCLECLRHSLQIKSNKTDDVGNFILSETD